MKQYLEIRIMKRNLLIIGVIIALLGICSGYYFWCSYHPDITVSILMGGKGEAIKAEVPAVTIAEKHGIKMAASTELKLLEFWVQYDHMNEYIRNNYKTADIKLNIEIKDDQTILKYTGTGTDLDDITADFDREISLDFKLDAEIIKRQ